MMAITSILSTKDWIWLAVILASACVALIAGVHKMHADGLAELRHVEIGINQRMLTMDEKWQERHAVMRREIHDDIKELSKNNPPQWLLKMVADNGVRIKDVENDIRSIERGDN